MPARWRVMELAPSAPTTSSTSSLDPVSSTTVERGLPQTMSVTPAGHMTSMLSCAFTACHSACCRRELSRMVASLGTPAA